MTPETNNELQILKKIIHTCNRKTELIPILDEILVHLLEVMGLDIGGVYLVDFKTKIAKLIHSQGSQTQFFERVREANIEDEKYHSVFFKGNPLIINDYGEKFPEISKLGGIMAIASIPLTSGDSIIGSLNLGSTKPYTFNEEIVKSLMSIGEVLGGTIDRIQSQALFKQSEEKYRVFLENFNGIAFEGYQDFSVSFMQGNVEEITGYSKRDFLSGNINFFDLIHPDDLEKTQRSVELFHSSPSSSSSRKHRIIKKNGEIRWILSQHEKLIDPETGHEGARGVILDITELETIQQQLKESEARFKLIADQSLMAIGIFQGNDIIYVNKTAAKLTEYAMEELLNMTVKDYTKIIHPDDLNFVSQQRKLKLEDGTLGVPHYQFRIITKSGDIRWLENFSNTVSYGNQPALLVTVIDIMTRKQAEIELSESKKRYKEMADLLPDIVFETDDQLNLTYVNEVAFKKFGYTVEDFKNGLNVEQIISPECIENALNKIGLLLKGQETPPAEYVLIKKDGTKFPARTNTEPIYNNNKIVGLRGTITDITDQKEAELKLQESEEQFRMLAEQSLASIVILQDDVFKYFNQQFTKTTGYSEEDIKSWKPGEFIKIIHPDFRDLVLEQARKKQAGVTDAITNYEFKGIKKDGSIYWCDIHSKSITYQGKPADFIITLDITDKKLIEKRIKESERKYRHLFQNSPFAIMIFDLKGFVIDCNEAVGSVLGYNRNDLIGLNFNDFDLYKLDEQALLLDQISDKIKHLEEIDPIELSLNKKNGDEIHARFYFSLISLDFEQYVQILATDITKEVKAAELIEESEERYRNLFESSPYYILLLDRDWRVIDCNSAIKDTIGFSKEEMIGNTLTELNLIPSEIAPVLKKRTKLLFEQGYLDPIEMEMNTKSGKRFWTKSQPSLVKIKDEAWIQIIGQDITTRKNAERMLKESEMKYRNLFETSPFSIVLMDTHGKVWECSDQFEQIYGYSKEEIMGDAPHIFTKTFKHKEDFEYFLRTLFLGKNINHYEMEAITKQGKEIWIEVQANQIEIGGKKYLQYLSRDINELKKAKIDLKKSEEKYRMVMTSMSDMIFIIDQEDRFVDVLAFSDQDIGINKVEFRHKSIHKMFPNLDHSQYKNAAKKIWKEGLSQQFEFTYKTPNSLHHFLVLLDLHHNKKDIIATIRDITDLKRLKMDLSISETRYKSLFDNSPISIVLLDVNGYFVDLNPAQVKIFGFSKEELMNKRFQDLKLFTPKSNLILKEYFKSALKGEDNAPIEIQSYRKNGSVIWVRLQLTMIKIEGKFYIQVLTQDINTTKQAQIDLKESEERYRSLVEGLTNANIGIDLINKNYGILYQNDVIKTIFRDLPGTKCHEIYKGKATPCEHCNMEESLTTGKILREDIRTIGDRYYEVFTIPLANAAGEFDKVIEMVIDITNRKEVEKTLKSLNKIKTDLLNRASHELKTPLVSICGAVDLLLENYDDTLSNQQLNMVNLIKQGSDRLRLLIENLLDVTRIENGKLIINKEDVDLVELISDSKNQLFLIADKRNISIIFHPSQLDFIVNIDPIRFEQVIVNLLMNAIKNTPPGGKIYIELVKENADYLDVIIKDTGIGFTEEELSTLFTKFGKIERYGQGQDILSDGTGLGLFICREIVELHGGEIWVESGGRNKGSQFFIRLPKTDV